MLVEQAAALIFLLNAASVGWRKLLVKVCDPYRPELHYMRGPGPKWRAARGIMASDDIGAWAPSRRRA